MHLLRTPPVSTRIWLLRRRSVDPERGGRGCVCVQCRAGIPYVVSKLVGYDDVDDCELRSPSIAGKGRRERDRNIWG